MSQNYRPFPALWIFVAVVAPLLGGCGGGDSDKDKALAGPAPPVEVLYNNGLDALNARRYASANDQFNTLEQNYPFSSWAVNAQIMQGVVRMLLARLRRMDEQLAEKFEAVAGAGSA